MVVGLSTERLIAGMGLGRSVQLFLIPLFHVAGVVLHSDTGRFNLIE